MRATGPSYQARLAIAERALVARYRGVWCASQPLMSGCLSQSLATASSRSVLAAAGRLVAASQQFLVATDTRL